MKARCECGALSAEISDEGSGVMCHCKACQRRTGSPFGMMVYYAAKDVAVTGPVTEYSRIANSGEPVRR